MFEEIQNLVWEQFELLPWANKDHLRQLSCGCLVLRDHGYMDLYVWSGDSVECEEADHYLVHDVHEANQPDFDFASVRERLRRYTAGWGEQKDVLAAFDKITEQ